MKKKFLALALTAVMALSLAACGGDTQSTDTDTSSDASGAESGGEEQDHRAVGERNLSGEAAAGGEDRFPFRFPSFVHDFIRMEPFSTSRTSIDV